MTALVPYVALLAVVAAFVLASGGRVRPWTVALHGLLTAAVLIAGVHVLGRPKPMWAEPWVRDEIEVVAAQYHPGIGIYVWTRSSPPVVYRLPWDVGTARKMQEAERETGGSILRRGQTDGGEWVPHPLPQAREKPKEVE